MNLTWLHAWLVYSGYPERSEMDFLIQGKGKSEVKLLLYPFNDYFKHYFKQVHTEQTLLQSNKKPAEGRVITNNTVIEKASAYTH